MHKLDVLHKCLICSYINDRTPALYFLYLKTLDILLLIVNISVADAFYNKNKYCSNLKIKFNMKDLFVVVKMTERWKNQSEEWTSLSYLCTL